MPYQVPEFPLRANLYTSVLPHDFLAMVFREEVDCQLRVWGSDPRFTSAQVSSNGLLVGYVALLFPAETDVRDESTGPNADVIECPAGSGRLYLALYVDDVAKGFPNEYRQVIVAKVFTSTNPLITNFPYWPTPIP